VKDLRIFGKDLNRTVFVDNCIYSYAFQLENGIPILPFNGDPTDKTLQDLLVYLMELKDFNNIAERNDEVLKQSQFRGFFSKSATVEYMINYLYKSDEMVRRNQFKCKRA
jgi:TFIIF-interacting CTD phosphatase-like protein